MSKKILLIEDDPFLSEIYMAKFEEAGFNISILEDGSRAIETIKGKKPDLVLLDILMPEANGFEILELVKDDANLRDIPVVILSNLGEQENVERGLKLGAAAYLVKAHYTPTEVVAEVKKILEGTPQ